MVTINTAADLLRALAENPRWKEAVRREILTEQRQVNAAPPISSPNSGSFNAEREEFNARIK